MALEPQQVSDIWESGHSDRVVMANMQKHLDGTHSIEGLADVRKDGQVFSKISVNWYSFVTDCHVGFMTSDRAEYEVEENKDGKEDKGLVAFKKVFQDNCLHAAGIEHLSNAIVFGRGVEVHSFDGTEIVITATRPEDWVFVRDEFGVMQVAVYRVKVPANSFFDGELLKSEKTIFFVYDKEEQSIFEKGEKGDLSSTSSKSHEYGQVPVIEFSVSKDRNTFFGKSFIDSANAYAVTRSLLQDEIKINVSALLATTGVEPKIFEQKDDKGVSALEHMKRLGIMALPPGATANWLLRNVDVAKFERDLELSRFAVHQQGYVPDIAQSLSKQSVVSSISGVALKLLYQPMIQKSTQFATYYKKGLRERVDLINTIQVKLQRPPLVNYTVTINKAVPQNSVEWAQYGPALLSADGISTRELLEQMDFIDDVDRVLAEIEKAKSKRNGEG